MPYFLAMKTLAIALFALLFLYPSTIILGQIDACWSWMIGGSGFNKIDAATTDASGNFWIAGLFEDSVDFDPGAGSFILSSPNGQQGFIASYDANGSFRLAWAMPGFFVSDMSADDSNNMYLSGFHFGNVDADPGAGTDTLEAFGGNDACVLAFDNTGNYLWGKSYGGPGSDEANSIIVKSPDKLLISGSFQVNAVFDDLDTIQSAGGSDIFYADLSTAGILNWVKSIGGPGFEAKPRAIASNQVGSSQNHLLFNYTDSVLISMAPNDSMIRSNGQQDIGLITFNDVGEISWVYSYGGAGSDQGIDLVTDSSGTIYQTGTFSDSFSIAGSAGVKNLISRGGRDVFVISHTPTGIFNTAIQAGGAEDDESTKLSIKLSLPKALILDGQFSSQIDFDDKIDPAGQAQDTRTLTSSGFLDSYLAVYKLPLTDVLDLKQFGGQEADIATRSYLSGINEDSLISSGRSSGSLLLADSSCTPTIEHVPTGLFNFWVQKEPVNINSNTSINQELPSHSFLIYPNPSESYLHIQPKEFDGLLYEIQLLDQQARVLQKFQEVSLENFKIGIQDLPSGIFILLIKDQKERRAHYKFVKR